MTDTYDGFHVERDAGSGIASITLDVPERMNRVSMAARDQLAGVFSDLGADDAVRVVVLGGAGEKAFTAGGDIPGFMTRTPEELSHLAQNIGAAERCPKPVVAQLHGFTFGVGLELALACDLRVLAEDAFVGLPETRLGLVPDVGGSSRLPQVVGVGRAKELIMTGRVIGAADAQRIGLANRVSADVGAATDELVSELLTCAPIAVGLAKRLIDASARPALSTTLELEVAAQELCARSEDVREGVQAAAERRAPNFQGR
jgi:2-oxoglutaroyl-CoA hydrolase